METNQKQFLYRLYFVASILVVLGLGIGYKVFHIQYIDGNNYRLLAKNKTIQNITVSPERGNIFSDDGSLLAASTISYDIFFDGVTVSNSNFAKFSTSLAKDLSVLLEKDYDFFHDKLSYAKKNSKRYYLIQRNVSVEDLNKIKKMPLFKLGGVRGGLIVEKKNSRDYPLNKIAERTIGRERKVKGDKFSGVGLEHAFGSILRGKDGMQLMQKISNGKWKPIYSNNQIEPVPGSDLHTTINVGFQDITHHSLLEQLEIFEADHGTAIVMETSTGEIKAISNLGRTTEGKYYERLNYAVGEHYEPGSTFKLMSVIAALEDGKADLEKMVDTENGILSFYGAKVRDSRKGGYGIISLNDAFKYSSNTGIVKIIYNAYKDDPEKFSNRLYNMGLNDKLGVSIKGESKPKIPHPKDKDWSGLSLPWMVYGYGVLLSPLQILTFYNAVANDGEMVKPIFAKKNNQNPFFYLDQVSLVAPVGIFFGRLANFINWELYGTVSDVPWSVIFIKVDNLSRHPSQLYEAILEGLILFIILIYFTNKNYLNKPGLISGLFLIFYSIFRFFIEFFRVPDEQIGYLILSLTMGQIISLVFASIGIAIFYLKNENK